MSVLIHNLKELKTRLFSQFKKCCFWDYEKNEIYLSFSQKSLRLINYLHCEEVWNFYRCSTWHAQLKHTEWNLSIIWWLSVLLKTSVRVLLKIKQNQLLINKNIETLNEKYWIVTQQFRDESDSAELKWDSIKDSKNKSSIHKTKPENSIVRILNCLQCWLTQN